MKILIAEDDRISRELLVKLLSKYGECSVACDGFEAVEAFIASCESNQPYELVCLDIMMPKFDGMETLKAIRSIEGKRKVSKENGVKIAIISAISETDLEFESILENNVEIISKPINIERFYDALNRWGFSAQKGNN